MKHSIPAVPQKLLHILGHAIALARKGRQWRQGDLGERIGITRQTVARIEEGDPSVAIGCYFTAAWILDVPIFQGMELKKAKAITALDNLLVFINEHSSQHVKINKVINDNF